jgi:hypothetical protein
MPGMPGIEWVNGPSPETVLANGPFPDIGGLGVGTGFPSIPKPVFRVDGRIGRTRLADGEAIGRGIWLVSEKTKRLLEGADKEAFAFLRVEIRAGLLPGPAYWLCDVVRFLDPLDPSHSIIGRRQSGAEYLKPKSPWDGVFRIDVVNSHQIFRLNSMPSNIYCSAELAEKIASLTGFHLRNAGVAS